MTTTCNISWRVNIGKKILYYFTQLKKKTKKLKKTIGLLENLKKLNTFGRACRGVLKSKNRQYKTIQFETNRSKLGL